MKVLPAKVEVIEVENEGFISLLGQQVEIRCFVTLVLPRIIEGAH